MRVGSWIVEERDGTWWAWPSRAPLSDAVRGRVPLYWWRRGQASWRLHPVSSSAPSSSAPSSSAPTGPGSDRVTVTATDVVQTGTPIGDIRYRIHPEGRYGSRFGDRRPDGLPSTARPVSERGAAYRYAEQIARAMGAEEDAIKAILSLLDNESGGEFGRPANAYDDPRRRSWGAFQFLPSSWKGMADSPRDYWYPREQVMPEEYGELEPYEFGPYEELYYPIRRYVLAYQYVRRQGGDERAGARAIRIYHSGSRWLRRFIGGGQENGFDWAAANMHVLAADDEDEDWTRKMAEYDSELRAWGVDV